MSDYPRLQGRLQCQHLGFSTAKQQQHAVKQKRLEQQHAWWNAACRWATLLTHEAVSSLALSPVNCRL